MRLDSRHFPFCICPTISVGQRVACHLLRGPFFTSLFENRKPSSLLLDAATTTVDNYHKGRALVRLDHSLYFICSTISMGQTVACHLLRGTLFYAV